MLSAVACDAPGADLPAVGDELAKQVRVFVIDALDFASAKNAVLALWKLVVLATRWSALFVITIIFSWCHVYLLL